MDVSKLGALFPKPVAAPSNGQSLGQVYKHIWLGSNLKKIKLPNSIWLRSGKPTHTKSAVFFGRWFETWTLVQKIWVQIL